MSTILLKIKYENISYHDSIQDAIKHAESLVFYGLCLSVYYLDDKGNEKPYYYNETALTFHKSTFYDVAESFGIFFKNDFGMYLGDKRFKQDITHRITYYVRPHKSGGSVSCPACFATDEDCINAALYTEMGKRMAKDCKEIVIEKYDYSSGCKLNEIKTISL